jgi:hypothetical protein
LKRTKNPVRPQEVFRTKAEAFILLFRTSQSSLPEILRADDPPSPSLFRLNSGFALHVRGR